jgi:hypothetical protein
MTPGQNDAWATSNVKSIISAPNTDATKPLSMQIQRLCNEANENVGYLKTSHMANIYYFKAVSQENSTSSSNEDKIYDQHSP